MISTEYEFIPTNDAAILAIDKEIAKLLTNY